MFFRRFLARLRYQIKLVAVWIQPLYTKKKLALGCGHLTQLLGEVAAFGETIVSKIPFTHDGQPLYCHACLSSMAIRCAWCYRPIFIGDGVTLYLVGQGAIAKKDTREYIHENGIRSLVGCLRCAEMGILDVQGIWETPGAVKRIPSGTKLALGAFQRGARAVIVAHH